MRKLKVFKAASGFHDSYVAVQSRAAALRAWGANTDLFAMGAAERVTEPAMVRQAIARPGVVFKRKRTAKGDGSASLTPSVPKRVRSRRPSRKKLDKLEKELNAIGAEHDAALRKLEESIDRLNRDKRSLITRHKNKLKSTEDRRDRAARDYETALERWAGGD